MFSYFFFVIFPCLSWFINLYMYNDYSYCELTDSMIFIPLMLPLSVETIMSSLFNYTIWTEIIFQGQTTSLDVRGFGRNA